MARRYEILCLPLMLLCVVAEPLVADENKLSTDDLTENVFAALQEQTLSGESGSNLQNDAEAAACDKVTNSDFNPHSRPESGTRPWFEGWYTRLTDEDGHSSFAIGIGHFPGQKDLPSPSVACFLLASTAGEPPRFYSRSFNSLRIKSPLQSPAGASGNCFTTKSITANNRNGEPSSTTDGTVSFLLESGGGGSEPGPTAATESAADQDFCTWEVTKASVRINARLGNARLRLRSAPGACAASDPWDGPEWPSPEGWLARLGFLLRLRYDVLSLRTLAEYELREDAGTDEADEDGARDGGSGGGGAAAPPPLPPPRPVVWRPGGLHLEKNWGESFPGQWIWAQGHRSDPAGQASFVLAGGLLPHVLQPLVPATRQYVLSYHPPPPAAPFTVDPRNAALFSSLTVRGCDGVFTLELYGVMHIVQVVASADPATFHVLPCPTATGFRNYSVESFSSRVQLRVLRRPYPFAPPAVASLLFEDTFTAAAIEFGGAYMCPDSKALLRRVEAAEGMVV